MLKKMKAISQLAAQVRAVNDRISAGARVDVFDGAAAMGQNLSGGTLPSGQSEVPMTTSLWQYNSTCAAAYNGGLEILVPGIYLIQTRMLYAPGAGSAWVTLGVSFPLPIHAAAGSMLVGVAPVQLSQSGMLIRRLGLGDTIFFFAEASAPIQWQWASLYVALLGMLE